MHDADRAIHYARQSLELHMVLRFVSMPVVGCLYNCSDLLQGGDKEFVACLIRHKPKRLVTLQQFF